MAKKKQTTRALLKNRAAQSLQRRRAVALRKTNFAKFDATVVAQRTST